MRIRHVEVTGFGGLRDRSSGTEPLGDFVVVLGDNEAGKTTLFEFLCSMLYGIYPTSAERHPYAPWDGTELAGTLRIQLNQDVVEVRRRLRSSPSGTLVRDGRSESLRNDDLPFVTHISARVFRQVYALGLRDLASLEEEGWEAVQDRILGRLGASDLRTAREVANELEAEARALWRPDRRGAPRVRRLDDAIREAAARRPEVRRQSNQRRAAAERLADTRDVLASARVVREADQAFLTRLRRWVPIRTELGRVAELRRVAGDPEQLSGLTTDPVGELDRLDERTLAAVRYLERCRSERDAARKEAEGLGEPERLVLEHAASIERLRAGTSAGTVLTPRLGAAEQGLRALERRIADEADLLPWSGAARVDGLLDLPTRSLAAACRRWSDAGIEVTAPPLAPSPASTLPAIILGLLGVLVVSTALPVWAATLRLAAIPMGYPVVFGAVLIALGVWLGAGVRSVRRANERQMEAATAAARARNTEELAARAAVQELVTDFGLEVGDQPDPELLPRLDRCRQLLRDRRDLGREVEEIRQRLEELEIEAAHLGDLLLLSAPGDAVAVSTLLQDRLARARDWSTSAERAASRLPDLDTAVEEAIEALEEARGQQHAFERRLEVFEGQDPRAAADAAARSVEAHREADRRWASLVREHPDLNGIVDAIRVAEGRGENWIDEADPLGSLAREIETRSEEIERWVALEKDLETQARPGDGDETIDDLEGEIRRLRQERDSVRREHDRLWILSALVNRADQELRELHQPAILRRAGQHLEALTGGRYRRLEVGSDRLRRLQVAGPTVADTVEVGPPLSTGTQEQIYVALRLALMDHLDDGQVRLPLFLDEVLVNWDVTRRDRGLNLLEEMTTRRQVFLFTCHPYVADEALARGATLWRLTPP